MYIFLLIAFLAFNREIFDSLLKKGDKTEGQDLYELAIKLLEYPTEDSIK